MTEASFTVVLMSTLGGWLLLCAGADLRWRKLPNIVTLGAYLPAMLSLILFHQSLLGATAFSALAGWLLAVFLTLPAYSIHWLGAGDVKMLSALGLMTSWPFLLMTFAIAGLLSGAVALFWLFLQRSLPYLNMKLARWDQQLPAIPVLQGKALPFGALLAVAGLIVLFLTPSPALI